MFRLLEWFFYKVLHFKHYRDKPCPHMKQRLSDLCDDTARGISRWYTERHVASCPGCSSTLQGLRRLRSRLLGLDKQAPELLEESEDADAKLTLSPERWQAVTESWEQTDEKLAATTVKERR
jgi:hypothetical protein